jgi:hypothetical protein
MYVHIAAEVLKLQFTILKEALSPIYLKFLIINNIFM